MEKATKKESSSSSSSSSLSPTPLSPTEDAAITSRTINPSPDTKAVQQQTSTVQAPVSAPASPDDIFAGATINTNVTTAIEVEAEVKTDTDTEADAEVEAEIEAETEVEVEVEMNDENTNTNTNTNTKPISSVAAAIEAAVTERDVRINEVTTADTTTFDMTDMTETNAAARTTTSDITAKMNTDTNSTETTDIIIPLPPIAHATQQITSTNPTTTKLAKLNEQHPHQNFPRISIASTYTTNDPEFEQVKTLYNNKEHIILPSKESIQDLKDLDEQIKDIVKRIDTTDEIDEIKELSEEGDKLETMSKKFHQDHREIEIRVRRINNARYMAQQASTYWLKEKRDLKKFGEWKIVLKMIDKVFPHSEEKLSAIETKKEEDNYDSGVDNLFKTTSKTVPAPRKAKQTKAKDDRIRQKRDWKFISEGTFKFYIQGGQKGNDSLQNQGFQWKNGYIYCSLCDTYLKRPVDMKQHIKSARHVMRLKDSKNKQLEDSKVVAAAMKDSDEVENMFGQILSEKSGDMILDNNNNSSSSSSSSSSGNDNDNDNGHNKTSSNTPTELQNIDNSQSMSEQAMQYWRNHKNDIKQFLEWKMMNRVIPSEKPSLTVSAGVGGLGGVSNNGEEVAIANGMVEGLGKDVIMVHQILESTTKKVRNPKSRKVPTRARPKIGKDNRLRKERDWQFIPESVFNFYLQGGKTKNETLAGHGLHWEAGYIRCTLCDTFIKRPIDMKQHIKSGRHQKKLKLKLEEIDTGIATSGDEDEKQSTCAYV